MSKPVDKVHQEQLALYDRRIAVTEARLKELQEGRREYINRHNLNPKNPPGSSRG
nr:MAG: hypothetical protein [Bacteriophage sp.]